MRSRRTSSAAALLTAIVSLTFVGAAGAEAPQINTPATISGTAAVGQPLTAHNGTWLYADGSSCQAECAMTYQWQRCAGGCADIGGATGRFYTVQAADAGHALRVMETMSKHDCGAVNHSAGTQECRDVSKSAPSSMTAVVPGSPPAGSSPPSAPTAPVTPAAIAPAASAAPTIDGLAMVNQTLSAKRGSWAGSLPLTLALQWQRCDAAGANCQDLGLSGDTYKVIRFDVGKTLRVRVTAVNTVGARDAVSAPTAVVTELKPTEQNPTLTAAEVIAPHRLVVAEATAEPARITRRARLQVSLRVMDTRGFRIEGALVTAVVLPRAAFAVPAEATSGADGLVELTFTPRAKLDLRKLKSVTIVLTARRPGDRLVSPRASVVRLKIPVRPTAKARSAR